MNFFEVHGVSGSVPATRKVVCNINQLGKQRLRIVEVIILFCVFVIKKKLDRIYNVTLRKPHKP